MTDQHGLDLAGGFPDVDRSASGSALIAFLDRLQGSPWARAYKQASLTMLRPAPGQRLLDVGCGTGEEVRLLAEVVGPTGRVVGLDFSQAMIDEARRRTIVGAPSRAPLPPVEFQVGDVLALPFADGAFDGCRADRTLQHVADPDRALAEMVRVTRPGGRIVVSEPDSDTKLIDAADRHTTRRVLEVMSDGMRSGWIGRQLYARCRAAGLTEIELAVHPLYYFDLARMDDAFRLRAMAEQAAARGLVTAEAAAAWLADLEAADAAGRFFGASFIFTAAATRPEV